MGINYPVYGATAAAVAFFSLTWFIVGLLSGRSLPRKRAGGPPRRGKRSRKRNDGGKPARGGSKTELYVGNLPYDVEEKEITKVFGKYGNVVSVRLIQHRFSGKPKGFGFIEMADRRAAASAIKALHGRDLKGRAMVVNEAKTKARD